jgi:hypothetical protein
LISQPIRVVLHYLKGLALQIMKKVEQILYAATEEEGRKALQDAQIEFAGEAAPPLSEPLPAA